MPNESWGSENIDASDIIIPKLLCMQGLSEFVAEDKAKPGDIVRSTTGEVLGNASQGVKIIPLTSWKTWVISEKVGDKFEFRKVEPYTGENANAPLEWSDKGSSWRRDRSLNFYVLLPQDIQKEREALVAFEKEGTLVDPTSALLPGVVSFRRTSYPAGKALATHFMMARKANRPPASTTFELKSVKEKNDKGHYHIFEVKGAGQTTAEDLKVCKDWYDVITKSVNSLKIDEEQVIDVDVNVSVNSEPSATDKF